MADEPALAPTESDGAQAPPTELKVPLLSDADLLAWSVVMSFRARQERDGITILRLPYPPCPSCGEPVDEVQQVTLDRIVTLNVRLTLKPCGHAYQTGDEYVRRLWVHIHELLADVTSGYRGHAEAARSWTTRDIVREAHVRVDASPEEGAPAPASDVSARAEQPAVAELQKEVARLRAGEEDGYAPDSEATPGQWLWRLHQAPAGERLDVIGRLLACATCLSGDRSRAAEPRLLDCGLCYEEQGEEVHPHPECPIGAPAGPIIGVARIGLDVQPGMADGLSLTDISSSVTAALTAVRNLHRPVEHNGQTICAECSGWCGESTDNGPVPHDQCGTLRAIASAGKS